MAAYLPRESATMLAVLPRSEQETWGDNGSYLLALIADYLAEGNWQRGGGRGPRPKPVPRPDDPDSGAEEITADDLRDFAAWYADQPGGRPTRALEA